ncbi:hypothetical protein OPV22_016245 [Ensete ventricosum]|uniref:DUF3741 domain-containing protein n=1 Tax=Ensete ventricosum TaxID=4639 RepID=A0AAV8PE34_ENSVE|nr:hypothetical protein OPV22_016245 [Ensete ventricosum]
MTSGRGRGLADRCHLERQMGCMAGLLHLFDRHQVLARKRLPPPPVAGSTSPSERPDASSAAMLVKENEVKDGVRTLSKRSRAMVVAKGKLRPREIRAAAPVASSCDGSDTSEAVDESEWLRRSPSVVARLMGLDALPDESDRAELRRSTSESHVPRDPAYIRFLDGSSFSKSSPVEAAPVSADEFIRMTNLGQLNVPVAEKTKSPARTPFLPPLQKKSFFDAGDFYPEPKRWGLLPIEFGKQRLTRVMDEAGRDLDTLKQILEALQLKGLLHSNPLYRHINGRRDHFLNHHYDSPIVVIEPAPRPLRRPSSEPRSPLPPPRPAAIRGNPAGAAATPPVRRNRKADQGPNGNNERINRGPSSPAKQRSSNVPESGKSRPSRRRISALKTPPNQVGQSPINRRLPPSRRTKQEVSTKQRIGSRAEVDAAASIANSPLGFERSWAADYRAGRQLLDRCDRLLHSITAFTAEDQVATVAVQVAAAAEQQPSPVSVLNSPILGEETSPRSPVSKRSIDFKGDQPAECNEDAVASDGGDGPETQAEEEVVVDDDDDDYEYVVEILRLTHSHGDTTDVYAFVEKARSDASKSLRLRRRLVLDAVAEILDRKRGGSPPLWESFVRPGFLSVAVAAPNSAALLLTEVWSELRQAREQASAADLSDVTSWAVGRDLAAENLESWARPAAEVADAVIQIERQIFKDLVSGAISDLADAKPRHKAVFQINAVG